MGGRGVIECLDAGGKTDDALDEEKEEIIMLHGLQRGGQEI